MAKQDLAINVPVTSLAVIKQQVLHHPRGLDPALGSPGFYGRGTYLSEEPCYQIGGRCGTACSAARSCRPARHPLHSRADVHERRELLSEL